MISYCRTLLGLALLVITFLTRNPLAAQSPIWGLGAGDTFSVETVIQQTTTVSLDDTKANTTEKTETLTIEYRVERILPTETQLFARITSAKADRKTASATTKQRLALLESSAVRLAVDNAGIARVIAGYEESLNGLQSGDEGTLKVLQAAYSSEVFANFFCRPFWMAAPEISPEKDAEWDRVDNVSIGTMGTLRTIANCKISEVDEEAATVTISGKGRYVPPAPVKSSRTFAFTNVTAKPVLLSGEGKMWLTPEPEEDVIEADETNRDELKPGFESLTLQWEIEGSATLKTGSKSVTVAFRESQTQKSRLLPGYRIGVRRRTFDYQSLPQAR